MTLQVGDRVTELPPIANRRQSGAASPYQAYYDALVRRGHVDDGWTVLDKANDQLTVSKEAQAVVSRWRSAMQTSNRHTSGAIQVSMRQVGPDAVVFARWTPPLQVAVVIGVEV